MEEGGLRHGDMGSGVTGGSQAGPQGELPTQPSPSPGLSPDSQLLLISSARHDLWMNRIKQGCWLLGCPGELQEREWLSEGKLTSCPEGNGRGAAGAVGTCTQATDTSHRDSPWHRHPCTHAHTPMAVATSRCPASSAIHEL